MTKGHQEGKGWLVQFQACLFTNARECCCLQLILNDEEVKIKTAMWMRQNADFLKEMKGICIVSGDEFNMISMCCLHI